MSNRRNIPTLHTIRAIPIPAEELWTDDVTPDGIIKSVEVMKHGVLITFTGEDNRWARKGQSVEVVARLVHE